MAASVPCPSASGANEYTSQPLRIPPKAGRKSRIHLLKGVVVGERGLCSPTGNGGL